MGIEADLTLLRLAARVDPVLREAMQRVEARLEAAEAENARLRAAAQAVIDHEDCARRLLASIAEPWFASRESEALRAALASPEASDG